MKVADALLRGLHAAALLAAAVGVTHLATVLMLPARAPDSAWERVRRVSGTVGSTLAGPALPDLGPDQDPALVTAVCRYDLRTGPVDATLPVGGIEFAALTVMTRHGRVLGGLTGRAASQDRLTLQVVRAGAPPSAAAARAVRVESSEPEGLVAAQVLFSTGSRKPGAEAAARALLCRPVPAG